MTDLRLYKPRISTWWWTRKRTYVVFVLRELSSVFVAWFVAYLLLLVWAVARGPAAYQSFLDWSAHPLVILLNVISLAFVVYHTITFINLTPQAMVVKLRGRRIPGRLLLVSLYAVWIVLSVLLAGLVLI
jgi:fumarate reductase subunit C